VGVLIFLVTLAMVAVSPAEEQPLGVLSAGVTDNLTASNAEWHFVVSGDSRNCGDLVMPAIAADAAQYHPAFYWHLGDLRAIYEMDEDYAGELTRDGTLREWNMSTYTDGAWDDVVQMQIRPFEDLGIPFLVGIGNHETILPKTRNEFIARFAKWLDSPMLRDQRIKDSGGLRGTGQGEDDAYQVQTYYHWTRGSIDFINLDNATPDQFDATQMAWLRRILEADRTNPNVSTIIVGMHETLPDSLSNFHSMSESATGQQSGRCAYRYLQRVQSEGHKQVMVLSSHSHFIMTNVYDSPFWRLHNSPVSPHVKPEVIPGILVGTAGAVRYRLPSSIPASLEDAASCTRNGRSFCAQTDVYGYLLATVNAKGKPGAIEFRFIEIKADNVSRETRQKFTPDTMKVCFEGNKQLSPSMDNTQYLPDGPCPQ
jgi:hypothetical protein